MTIRDQVKAELDKVDEEYLEVVRRMIESLERSSGREHVPESWREFLRATYGSLANAPIQRGEQGEFEPRAPLR